jgi:hypothetical protein
MSAKLRRTSPNFMDQKQRPSVADQQANKNNPNVRDYFITQTPLPAFPDLRTFSNV